MKKLLIALLLISPVAFAGSFGMACTADNGYVNHLVVHTTKGFKPTLTTTIGSSTTKQNPSQSDFKPITHELNFMGDKIWSTGYFNGVKIDFYNGDNLSEQSIRIYSFGDVSDETCVVE